MTRTTEGYFAMQCPVCGTVNNPGRTYCGGCARAVGVVCPACFFVNESIDHYCGGCARDLPAAPIAPAAPVRTAAVGPAAPAVAMLGTPVVSPDAKGDHGVFLNDLEDLADLAGGTAPGGSAAEPPSGSADVTQSDVDGFFQRLAREGVAEIPSPGPAVQPPAPPRSAPS